MDEMAKMAAAEQADDRVNRAVDYDLIQRTVTRLDDEDEYLNRRITALSWAFLIGVAALGLLIYVTR